MQAVAGDERAVRGGALGDLEDVGDEADAARLAGVTRRHCGCPAKRRHAPRYRHAAPRHHAAGARGIVFRRFG